MQCISKVKCHAHWHTPLSARINRCSETCRASVAYYLCLLSPPPPLSCSASLFGNNENKTHVSLICCGIWATPTGQPGREGREGRQLMQSLVKNRLNAVQDKPPCLPPLRSALSLSTGPAARLEAGRVELGAGKRGVQSQLKSHEIMAITLSSHLFL